MGTLLEELVLLGEMSQARLRDRECPANRDSRIWKRMGYGHGFFG